MITGADWQALSLSMQLAGLSTLLLLVFATPLALWLAYSRSRWVFIFEAIIALPLVLPPTVLGFYLLLSFSPDGWLGSLLNHLGLASVSFSFTGLVIGSMLYSLPFVVQPIQRALQHLGRTPWQAAASLGANRWRTFTAIILPLTRRSYVTATVMGFAHTLGEFGVVLMIGGNIPGKTQVVSIALYDKVEALEFADAHRLAAFLLALSFVLLLIVFANNRSKHEV